MKPKLNAKNVMNFIEGNFMMLGDKINLLPKHLREQVIWRYKICENDCVKARKCVYCGCSIPGKLYVGKSCNNGERFPDIMSQEEWSRYKISNNIKL